MTPPITLDWPSLTSRRKNEVVHQYVALSEDLLDVPDYLGDANATIRLSSPHTTILKLTDGRWLVEMLKEGQSVTRIGMADTFSEAACLALLRAKGIVVNT